MNNNIRILLASALSLLILLGWDHYFGPNNIKSIKKENVESQISQDNTEKVTQDSLSLQEDTSSNQKRVFFKNKSISGSINLKGAKIDDLTLLKYHTTIKHDSPNVVLLSPSNTQEVYYLKLGWISQDISDLPTQNTVWKANIDNLNPRQDLLLTWQNAQGIKFEITISLDQDYMFSIKQNVQNLPKDTKITPYSGLTRSNFGLGKSETLIHEGAIIVTNDKLKEISFEDLEEDKEYKFKKDLNNWLGFTTKYWITAIIPQNANFQGEFSSFKSQNSTRYQSDVIINDERGNADYKFYAGAKELDLLDKYEEKYNIKLFDRAVDFGLLYFITKPIFVTLSFLYSFTGNFGIAIILLTICTKLILFPLALKGFKGMNRLKELQPETSRIKAMYANDSTKMQQAIVDLYKKEKVSPLGGCLPIILQMPIFFALYKVLYVALEMRHAPFYLWIKDLSSPDPTNIFNLFGLIPWTAPSFLHIGVLPIIMALSLYIQQKLTPNMATDPMQAKIIAFLPVVFVFMFASFPSGLVLYWSCSNILSIAQQVLVKKLS